MTLTHLSCALILGGHPRFISGDFFTITIFLLDSVGIEPIHKATGTQHPIPLRTPPPPPGRSAGSGLSDVNLR